MDSNKDMANHLKVILHKAILHSKDMDNQLISNHLKDILLKDNQCILPKDKVCQV